MLDAVSNHALRTAALLALGTPGFHGSTLTSHTAVAAAPATFPSGRVSVVNNFPSFAPTYYRLNIVDGNTFALTRRHAFRLSDEATLQLGAHGVDRFLQFAELKDGWAGDGARMLWPSLQALNAFFSYKPKFQSTPSIFMERNGALAIAGETSDGKSVEISFQPGGIELFIESQGLESVIPLEIQEIASVVRSINAAA